MSQNPIRGEGGPRGLADAPTPPASADGPLAGFRSLTQDLRRQVAHGDLTPKVARDRAAEAAERLAAALDRPGSETPTPPRPFLDRLIAASNARTRARANISLEGHQRETNLLLRQGLIEQQLATRAAEFEGRAFARNMHGGPPAPTLTGLLAFHESAQLDGDEAAQEWGRRQLESFRPRVAEPEDLRRLDRACDRPDRVNPRIVAAYVEALRGHDPAELETFVAHALEGRDASACTAAFELARESPEGLAPRWVRSVLDGLGEFPDAALAGLRHREVEAARDADEAARSRAQALAETARGEARLSDLVAPSAAELARQARVDAKPLAGPEQAIGLALDRRGLDAEEFRARLAPAAE